MHTDIPTRADLERLLAVRDAACVSIYVPTTPEEPGGRDRIAFKTFQVANRLSPMVEVSDRFHVKPLLRSATFPHAAFVLALSQNAARLVEVSPATVRVPDMPEDAASAVDTAFVDIDETVPGFVDETDGALTLAAADGAVNDGVVEEIARRVLLTGGRVLAVRRDDIPGRGPAAATSATPCERRRAPTDRSRSPRASRTRRCRRR